MASPNDPILLPPPPIPEESVGTPGEVPNPRCVTTFYEKLEKLVRTQSSRVLNLQTSLQGVTCCVFNPVFSPSQYNDDDQNFFYNDVEDFTDKLMIVGLAQYLRFSGTDQWSMPEVTLYYDTPTDRPIHENAKIITHIGDQRTTFRAKYQRVIIGGFLEFRRVYQLIPFN